MEERESRARRLRTAAVPYLLLLPAIVALAARLLYPTIDGVRASLHRYRYALDTGYTGGDNFVAVYGDAVFWKAMATTVQFIVCTVSIETLLGLLLALVVARELRFAGLIRVTLILPMTIAPVVVGVIWRLLYASGIGVVDPLFQALGFDAPNVLAHGLSAFLGLVVVDVWEWTPLMFLIILAGLHSLPQDPIEAARVDGASALQTSSSIIRCRCCVPCCWWPSCCARSMPSARSTRSIVLTKGGPGTATQLISIYAYNTAFLFSQYGRAMAMLISLLACLLLLMAAAVHFMRRQRGDRRMTLRERLGAIFVYLTLGVAIFLALFPFWWMLVTSLKLPVDIFSHVALWPQQITFGNYYRLFAEFHFGPFLLNSVVIVIASVGVSLVIGTLAAYALARFRLRFGVRHMTLYLVLLVRMLPESCCACRSTSRWRNGAC